MTLGGMEGRARIEGLFAFCFWLINFFFFFWERKGRKELEYKTAKTRRLISILLYLPPMLKKNIQAADVKTEKPSPKNSLCVPITLQTEIELYTHVNIPSYIESLANISPAIEERNLTHLHHF